MATIKAATSEKVFPLKAFLGLHQNPDGDTKLKLGEAAEMRNWRITRDGNLQRRPGMKTILDLGVNKPIKGLWSGFVSGKEYMLGACNGKFYMLWDDYNDEFAATELGNVDTSDNVQIFPFENMVYILDGKKYRQWDGTTYKEVDGYVPLVWTAIPPTNGNSTDESASLENVNRLTAKRRVWISPDGTGDTFQLPEKSLQSVDYVLDNATGNTVTTGWSADTTNGTVTFTSPPAQATNSYEIGYTAADDDGEMRSQVESQKYYELFAGSQDTRIFLYGDGSNRCIYSGIDYNGNPRADYFPDLYECAVGDENTPITGMIRHYSQLVCYKSNSTWMIAATQATMADGLNVPAFFVTPVNRTIGNAALGQVRLVLNSPYTLFGNDLYQWTNSSYYTSNLTSDERQAKRISDRIWKTLEDYDAAACYCYDDNDNQEYYIVHGGEALVCNYAADAWYRYTNFPAASLVNLHENVYLGTTDGKLKHLDYRWLNDDGEAIPAYWESGSMAFGQDYMRKYSAMLWVGIKPEVASEVWATVQTDRSSTQNEKIVESFMASFSKANFGRWSFRTNRKPHMKRLKIKAKKFVFYKLVFHTETPDTRATVLAADIRVRYTGNCK